MDIVDNERGEEKDKGKEQSEALTGEKPSVSIESKECDEYEIITVRNSGEQEHKWEDIPEFRQEISLIRQERKQRRAKE
jgi:hypothetical protein